MDWHVIGPLNPLDLYGDCSVPLDEYITKNKDNWRAVSRAMAAMEAYEKGSEIKNAPFRGQPHVFFDPFSDSIGLIVKQEANGTTYLVVHNSDPYQQLLVE